MCHVWCTQLKLSVVQIEIPKVYIIRTFGIRNARHCKIMQLKIVYHNSSDWLVWLTMTMTMDMFCTTKLRAVIWISITKQKRQVWVTMFYDFGIEIGFFCHRKPFVFPHCKTQQWNEQFLVGCRLDDTKCKRTAGSTECPNSRKSEA